MTLDDAKVLLSENNISLEVDEYENEKEYWHHTMLFPYTKNAKNCKVFAIVIKSNNGKKNIELQFNENNGVFFFEELRFGGYCFELFDIKEGILVETLIDDIVQIQKGNLTVIEANNLNKRCWSGDAIFDLDDEDDVFGKSGLEKAILHIKKPKGLLSKIFGSKMQYEIYDWNIYQSIVK